MKKQIYLHIGMGKTGTSALQVFFTINRDILERNGIIYPHCLHDRKNHHYLGWSLMEKYGRGNNHRADIQDFDEEWGHVFSQLNEKKNLISSELLSDLSLEEVSAVKQYVSEFDAKIVIYLRRHDHRLNSLINQRIKGGKDVRKLQLEKVATDPLEAWAQVFDKNNIIVRPYEKGQFYEGSIFADFLHYALGLKLTEEYDIPTGKTNLHLHRSVMEYKRMINLLSGHTASNKLIKPPILQEISKEFFAVGRRDDPLFSPQERLEMIERSAPRYAQIARDYLGRSDGKLFYEPLPDLREDWQPYEPHREEDTRHINRCLASN